MLKDREIIGFHEPRAAPGFELIAELQRQRRTEIARVTELAARLTQQFGAETAAGFLYSEILGRSPDGKVLRGYAERLQRTPSMVAAIVERLLALVTHSNERSNSV
jgi:hypothetical protein